MHVICNRQSGGYIALLSVLIVSAISSAAVLILFTTSLSSMLNSSDALDGKNAKLNADACAELVLQRIANGETNPCSSPTQICGVSTNLPQGSCIVISIDGGGTNWHIRTSGASGTKNIVKYDEIFAAKPDGNAPVVKSWREVEGF